MSHIPVRGSTLDNDSPIPPGSTPAALEEQLEAEFREFYTRAWNAGLRADMELLSWAMEIHDELSAGRTKIVIYNDCYGGRQYTQALEDKIKDVREEVASGRIMFDPNDEDAPLVEAVWRLGKEVDERKRREKGIELAQDAATVSLKEDAEVQTDEDTAKEKERRRILCLGLREGGAKPYAYLTYTEPLMTRWHISEYDGMETVEYC